MLRIFDEGKVYKKDEYEWCATMLWIDDTTVEFLGILTAPLLSQWKAIAKAMRACNVEHVIFRRLRPDKTIELKRMKV